MFSNVLNLIFNRALEDEAKKEAKNIERNLTPLFERSLNKIYHGRNEDNVYVVSREPGLTIYRYRHREGSNYTVNTSAIAKTSSSFVSQIFLASVSLVIMKRNEVQKSLENRKKRIILEGLDSRVTAIDAELKKEKSVLAAVENDLKTEKIALERLNQRVAAIEKAMKLKPHRHERLFIQPTLFFRDRGLEVPSRVLTTTTELHDANRWRTILERG